MTVTIAIANQKGGVGKTTTTVNLAHGLASKGRRVLVVDLDPQGHVAVAFGVQAEPGLFRLTHGEKVQDIAKEVRPNLQVILGDNSTELANRDISREDFREYILTNALKNARGFDVIILDTAPSINELHVNALMAAQWVLIPTQLDALSLQGVNKIIKTMDRLAGVRREFEGIRIIPTFYDRTTKETAYQLKALADRFGTLVWPPIPRDTRAREAAAYGKTLWEFDPEARAVVGYAMNGKQVGGYQDVLAHVMEEIC